MVTQDIRDRMDLPGSQKQGCGKELIFKIFPVRKPEVLQNFPPVDLVPHNCPNAVIWLIFQMLQHISAAHSRLRKPHNKVVSCIRQQIQKITHDHIIL